MDERECLLLVWELSAAWKDYFGLYTQYIGYLSANQIKTLLVLKKISDEYGEFVLPELGLNELNRKAKEYGVEEFGNNSDMNGVLTPLYAKLNKYDFSNIDENVWDKLLSYLVYKEKKKDIK